MGKRWKKAIMLIDMDAFFAAVEILDNPQLRNRAVSVTNGIHGSTIITCSYVARRYGIHTGMSIHKARHLCPDLVNVAARHQRYHQLSTAIMHYIGTAFTPDIEVFSVDEAFLDVTRCQTRFPHLPSLAKAIQQGIYNRFHLPASIGLSGDKTTAKYAAKCAKPYGIQVIPPERAAHFLKAVPVTELCGIAHNIAYVLAEYGVHYCADIMRIPKSILQQRLGVMGVRIWYMCQGLDPAPVYTSVKKPRTMGHGKVLPPHTNSKATILYYFAHMAAKLSERLHQEGYYAKEWCFAIRTAQKTWIKSTVTHTIRYRVYESIMGMIHHFLAAKWQGEVITHVQITAGSLQAMQQLDLFEQGAARPDLQQTLRDINHKYPNNPVTYARIIEPIK